MTNQTGPTESPKAKADALLNSLLKGKSVYGIFSENLRKTLEIAGHPVDYWRDYFHINIPKEDLTPVACKQLDVKIMELYQEASLLHAVAVAKSQMIRKGSDTLFRDKFAALVQEYKETKKKLPAAVTLENLAKVDSDDIESAVTISDVEVKFWKNILDNLSTCRKIIENATLNISVEMKALSNERYIDHINKNYNNGGK